MFSKIFYNPVVIFILTFLIISIPLFLFPINLFPGEVIQQIGAAEIKRELPLSLSYFIGIGYEPEDLVGIKNFYLLPRGYALAFCLLFGFPAIMAFRVYIAKRKFRGT